MIVFGLIFTVAIVGILLLIFGFIYLSSGGKKRCPNCDSEDIALVEGSSVSGRKHDIKKWIEAFDMLDIEHESEDDNGYTHYKFKHPDDKMKYIVVMYNEKEGMLEPVVYDWNKQGN